MAKQLKQATPRTTVEVVTALKSFPYFVLRNEIQSGYNDYVFELKEIARNYFNYKFGTDFVPEGASGDYVPTTLRYKIAKTLINKEARFMFSQTPDITIQGVDQNETTQKMAEEYQTVLTKVFRASKFPKKLLQSAKDCFIGKRVAILVDYSEEKGAMMHFYNSLEFFYENEVGTETLSKFVSFERVQRSTRQSERRYLVNRYVKGTNTVRMSSLLYDGSGNLIETLVEEHDTDLEEIPAVVIINDGTLEEDRGISEMEDLSDYEAVYSQLGGSDVDSERKGMNPIRYTVDMNSATTQSLPSGAGAYWDLKSEQNQNEVHPSVGTLSPSMQHTEPVKTTMERIKTTMYSEVDVPNITEETMVGSITSGKALKALYWPLTVRCNEKLKTWIPALEEVVRFILELVLLNEEKSMELYVLNDLQPIQYKVLIKEQYAIMDDETEEKELDITEINANARSRKSYIKKWRADEFDSEEQIDEELMQIALENNMMDTLSANTSVQNALNDIGTEQIMNQNIDDARAGV